MRLASPPSRASVAIGNRSGGTGVVGRASARAFLRAGRYEASEKRPDKQCRPQRHFAPSAHSTLTAGLVNPILRSENGVRMGPAVTRRCGNGLRSCRDGGAAAENTGKISLTPGVDADIGGHAGAKRRLARPFHQPQLDRQTLHHLDPVPLAFCGGRIANSAPVAGLMLSTWASHVMSGCMSSTTVAFCPTVT